MNGRRHTRAWLHALCIALFATVTGCEAQPVSPGEPFDLQVLFIGNSLTYSNGLPAIFKDLAEAAGVNVAIREIARPNYALEDHWSDGDAQSEIARGGWDIVVLQQGPSSLPQNRVNLVEWSQRFAEEIRRSGARPALYMVWPANGGDYDAVSESYRQAAVAVDGLLVPGGEAWREAWRRDPSLRLYASDGFHPSILGSYLVALAMLEELAGPSATAAPDIGLGIPAGTRALLGEAAHQAVATHGRD